MGKFTGITRNALAGTYWLSKCSNVALQRGRETRSLEKAVHAPANAVSNKNNPQYAQHPPSAELLKLTKKKTQKNKVL